MSPQDLAKSGTAFALSFPSGKLVYVLRWLGRKLWICAAAGKTNQATAQALQAIEQQARDNEATAVMFQTARPGLVKLAQRSGYRVTGWILEKAV